MYVGQNCQGKKKSSHSWLKAWGGAEKHASSQEKRKNGGGPTKLSQLKRKFWFWLVKRGKISLNDWGGGSAVLRVVSVNKGAMKGQNWGVTSWEEEGV